MRIKWIVWGPVLLVLVLAAIVVPAAQAGNVHFLNTTFTIGSLVMQGDLVGMGNDVAEVTLTGYGTVTAMCENKGGQQALGRNPIPVDVQQTDVFVPDANGRALVQVTAQDPTFADFVPSPTPRQAGCPNGNWKVVDIVEGSTDWTAATVVVKDESGQVQIDQSYTCTTFFENGIATDIDCNEN